MAEKINLFIRNIIAITEAKKNQACTQATANEEFYETN
jgi:hypothetical protein